MNEAAKSQNVHTECIGKILTVNVFHLFSQQFPLIANKHDGRFLWLCLSNIEGDPCKPSPYFSSAFETRLKI